MFIRRVICSLISILVLQCCIHSKIASQEGKIVPQKDLPHNPGQKPLSLICDMVGFEEKGSWLVQIYKPFIVRKVKGKLIPYNVGNTWYEDLPLFEIRAMGQGTTIHRTPADKKGMFIIEDLPEGLYCFHVGCKDYVDYLGVIIIDNDANPKNSISIVVDRDH